MHFDLCPVCDWEDDPVQADDPSYPDGANDVSLTVAQQNYRDYGHSHPEEYERSRGRKQFRPE